MLWIVSPNLGLYFHSRTPLWHGRIPVLDTGLKFPETLEIIFTKVQSSRRWLQATLMHAVGHESEQAWLLCCSNSLLFYYNLWPGWWNQFGRALLVSTLSNAQTCSWTEIGKGHVWHYAGALRWQWPVMCRRDKQLRKNSLPTSCAIFYASDHEN